MSVDTQLAVRVASVRSFNRFLTGMIGALNESLLRSPFTLTEARVIFELAQRDQTEATRLRWQLGLDAGYLSRILTRFAAGGLITRTRAEPDTRRQIVRLTDAGRSAFARLDERSSVQVRTLLTSLSEADQRRLVAAMRTIQTIWGAGPGPAPVIIRPPRPGDFGWIVQAHGASYAREFEWDVSFEALVARIIADYLDNQDRDRDAAWIAEVDGEPVGCVLCVRRDDQTAQLRLLLVEPGARGMGIGGRLVDECIRFARDHHYRQLMLWTNDVLVDARRIYERAGFRLVEESAHHSFGHDLVGQNWLLWLDEPGE
jgi:DNA-binding MarR family transcriptional regulator/GNAT superfamily N-acetyltransferase